MLKQAVFTVQTGTS